MTRHGYDAAGRVYRTAQWASNVLKHATNTDYHGWHHVVDAPVHSDVTHHTNALGQVTSVVERPVSGTITTAYTYTRQGDLATITDTAGNVSSYTYDDLRRRTASSDPDQGAWSTTYTADGDVFEVTDAKAEKVSYVYDRARRRTHAYSGAVGGPLLAQWTYDTATPAVSNAIGRLTTATSYSGGAAYTTAVTGYDDRGRVTGRRWDIPSAPAAALAGSYAYTYGYNAGDDLVSVGLPAVGDPQAGGLPAETVTTGLNAAGLPVPLTGAASYVGSTTYQPDGRLASRSLVGGVTRTFTYDSTAGRLSRLVAQVGTGKIEDTTYAYDADSNVTSITDAVAGVGATAQRECFTYDPLNRLTAAYTTSATSCGGGHVAFGADPYTATYAYNNVGNLTSTTVNGTTSAYVYGVAGHAHAPASIGGAAYVHDANGATTTRPTSGGPQTLTWDRFHRLTSVSGPGASSFVYDADGNRLLRTTGTTTTLYLDGMELSVTGSAITAKRFYGGAAMRTSGGVSVLLHNRQNSTTAAYNTVSGTVAYQRYTPYGSRRGTTPLAATDRRFLDKTEDATGLIAMGARYYDPLSSRFLSVDPLIDFSQPNHSPHTRTHSATRPHCQTPRDCWLIQMPAAAATCRGVTTDPSRHPRRRPHLRRPPQTKPPGRHILTPRNTRSALRHLQGCNQTAALFLLRSMARAQALATFSMQSSSRRSKRRTRTGASATTRATAHASASGGTWLRSVRSCYRSSRVRARRYARRVQRRRPRQRVQRSKLRRS